MHGFKRWHHDNQAVLLAEKEISLTTHDRIVIECYVAIILGFMWLLYQYTLGLLHWYCGNHTVISNAREAKRAIRITSVNTLTIQNRTTYINIGMCYRYKSSIIPTEK